MTYARHRQAGELCAFVAVTIAFEAIEGGGMEEVEAVSNLCPATAVFRLDHGKWQTDGLCDLQSQSDRSHRLLPGQPGVGRSGIGGGRLPNGPGTRFLETA